MSVATFFGFLILIITTFAFILYTVYVGQDSLHRVPLLPQSLINSEISKILRKNLGLLRSFYKLLGIKTPRFCLVKEGDFLNYSLISTSVNLDLGLLKIENLIEDLVKLGELQKRALSLAQELEKTRRRVNALEFIYIPRLKATIKYIFNKLEERERFEKIILMKSKEKIASLG